MLSYLAARPGYGTPVLRASKRSTQKAPSRTVTGKVEERWLILTGVHAVRDPDGSHEVRHVEDIDVRTSDGRTVQASIYARDGAAGLGELTEMGDMAFLPLERLKTERRSSGHGYRFYNLYRLPDAYGGGRAPDPFDRQRRGRESGPQSRRAPPGDPATDLADLGTSLRLSPAKRTDLGPRLAVEVRCLPPGWS